MKKILPRSFCRARGFTLMEMCVALVVFGVVMGIMFSALHSNWFALDDYTMRAQLWQDMDRIVDGVTDDARACQQITVAADQKSADFINATGAVIATHRILNTGEFQTVRGGITVSVTRQADYAGSSFTKKGRSVVLTMVLADRVTNNQGVSINAATEIYPRN